jgi:CRISPR system Cascade subunit CasA
MNNLLAQPLIHAAPHGYVTLPSLLAALARDEVVSLPALRPHQRPAWHMFLVQLAALALHGAGETQPPQDEEGWLRLLRGLTPDFPDDEPWRLAAADWSKPAFLQPPVPEGLELGTEIPSADALDLLITSRNHDLKQTIARLSEPQDWIFALVSLQTGEGYGGAGNQGIARMNGGSSSRPFLGLAPRDVSAQRTVAVRSGAHFSRDVRVMLDTRAQQLERWSHLSYPEMGGLGLTWLAPWPEGEQLQLGQLDIWFIEVCRRVRLTEGPRGLAGWRGISKATRINAKHVNGAVGDPWAPVHKTGNKSLTLGDGDFDYRKLTELLLSGDWERPILACPASFEGDSDEQVLIAEALARGNSKTEGFKSRLVPIGGKISRMLSLEEQREKLHAIAQTQAGDIGHFKKALSVALALVAARGDSESLKKDHYAFTAQAQAQLDREADTIFFPHLWARFEAEDHGSKAIAEKRKTFAAALHPKARMMFEAALPSIPCASIFRPRAEARARSAFRAVVRKHFPELFAKEELEEAAHADG